MVRGVSRVSEAKQIMTKKQIAIIVAISIISSVSCGTIIFLCGIYPTIPLLCLMAISCFTGIFIVVLANKWEREQEMASIVAERLLHKPRISDEDWTKQTSGVSQSNMAQLSGAGQAGFLGSLIGNNPTTTQPVKSNFPRIRK